MLGIEILLYKPYQLKWRIEILKFFMKLNILIYIFWNNYQEN